MDSSSSGISSSKMKTRKIGVSSSKGRASNIDSSDDGEYYVVVMSTLNCELLYLHNFNCKALRRSVFIRF